MPFGIMSDLVDNDLAFFLGGFDRALPVLLRAQNCVRSQTLLIAGEDQRNG